MKTELDNTFFHPSGTEVQRTDISNYGFLFTALSKGVNLNQEVRQRIPRGAAKLLPLSEEKLFVENAVPVKILGLSDDSMRLSRPLDVEIPVTSAEQIYKSTMSSLTNIIYDHRQFSSEEELETLMEIDFFRREKTRWATLTGKGALITQEPGRFGEAWICIVPPDFPPQKRQKHTFSAGTDNIGVNAVLTILPYDFSSRWATLGLVHELSHLRDTVLKIEPVKNRTRDQYLEGEYRAYYAERAMAMAFSKGSLQPTLKHIVNEALLRHGPHDFLQNILAENLGANSQSLDQCISPERPRSGEELGIRTALHQMLLFFEVARQSSNGDAESQKGMVKKFIEQNYDRLGILPKE